ncbi:MAG TPA: hypothetical protein VF472_13185 [Burkholderiaceae bacterium]
MSYSLYVRTASPTAIDVEKLIVEVSRVASLLINQSPELPFEFELQVAKALEASHPDYEKKKWEWQNVLQPIVPSNELFSFNEKKFLGYGIHFMYRFDEYWQESDANVPTYEFVIPKMRPRNDDMQLLICTALIIAVAHCLSEEIVLDTSGLWATNGDEISVADLLKFQISEEVSVEEGLHLLFRKIRNSSSERGGEYR